MRRKSVTDIFPRTCSFGGQQDAEGRTSAAFWASLCKLVGVGKSLPLTRSCNNAGWSPGNVKLLLLPGKAGALQEIRPPCDIPDYCCLFDTWRGRRSSQFGANGDACACSQMDCGSALPSS